MRAWPVFEHQFLGDDLILEKMRRCYDVVVVFGRVGGTSGSGGRVSRREERRKRSGQQGWCFVSAGKQASPRFYYDHCYC